MSAVGLAEELDRLDAEIMRLEERISADRAGIVDHILLAATRRTHARALEALEERYAERLTLPGLAPVPLGELHTLAPTPLRKPRPARAMQSGTQRRVTADFWVAGIGSEAPRAVEPVAIESVPRTLARRSIGARR
jgi:hypothetical protein